MNYIGIDVGGTKLKGGIVTAEGTIISEAVKVTPADDNDLFVDALVDLINTLLKETNTSYQDYLGIGLGVPGIIDSKHGVVIFSGNLKLDHFPLGNILSSKFNNIKIKLTNDANAAALGEAYFGAGKEYSSSVLVTLGTGIGGGIIINKHLFEGGKSAGGELGHMVINKDGLTCSCGRKGCFEMYASARALKRQTKFMMEQNPQSKMFEKYTIDNVRGHTPFEYYDKDETAKKIIDQYINYLSCGLVNIANIIHPNVIMIGGGVSNEGEFLINALNKKVNHDIYLSEYAPVLIKKASLENKAGIIGAASLFMEK